MSSRKFDARLAAEKSWLTSSACGSIEPPTSIRRSTRTFGFLRRAQHDLELARVARRLVDRRVEVELELVALARERAELAERDLDLAHVEHEVGAVRPVVARVGDGHRAASAALRAHAHPRGVRPVRAEGARAAGANPAVAAVVALLLLLQALLEELAQLLEVEVLEHRELLGREVLAHLRVAQPLLELLRELDATWPRRP